MGGIQKNCYPCSVRRIFLYLFRWDGGSNANSIKPLNTTKIMKSPWGHPVNNAKFVGLRGLQKYIENRKFYLRGAFYCVINEMVFT